MASTPGFEPGSHWWETSALTTAPPLFPNVSVNSKSNLKQKKKLAPPKVHLGWVIGQEV